MAFVSSASLAVLLGIVALYVVNRLRSKGIAQPLPPGPKGVPLLGNVNDLPKPDDQPWQFWLQHKDLYGPISSITVLGQTFVIINDAQIAFELMRDRSAIHSSRPGQVFSGQMVGWRHATAMSPYTDTWKIHRKNITKIASTNVSVSMFDRVQEVEATRFLGNLLETPADLFDHIRKEAGAVILKVTYGYTTEHKGRDPFVDLASKTMAQFAEATVPGKWIVDVMPFLRHLPDWVPGTGFKDTARKMALQLKQCVDQPYAFVKHQMREKKHNTSFLSQCIQDIGDDAQMEFVHKWAALALYLGGADTTVSSLMTFFLAVTVFPDVQKKAKEELDRVIGSSRLPVAADKGRLPYIEAIMKEVHRWHPVLPMGLPHSSIEEDVCQGYRIPRDSVLLPNNWFFTHDPAVYPEPMEFNPDRHIATPGHAAEPDPRNYIFGYGRRICPGRYVADNALFITIAQSLAVFDVTAPVVDGKAVVPEVKFEPGTISHPLPYKTDIKPRSENHAELIRRAEADLPIEESDAKELENIKW